MSQHVVSDDSWQTWFQKPEKQFCLSNLTNCCPTGRVYRSDLYYLSSSKRWLEAKMDLPGQNSMPISFVGSPIHQSVDWIRSCPVMQWVQETQKRQRRRERLGLKKGLCEESNLCVHFSTFLCTYWSQNPHCAQIGSRFLEDSLLHVGSSVLGGIGSKVFFMGLGGCGFWWEERKRRKNEEERWRESADFEERGERVMVSERERWICVFDV